MRPGSNLDNVRSGLGVGVSDRLSTSLFTTNISYIIFSNICGVHVKFDPSFSKALIRTSDKNINFKTSCFFLFFSKIISIGRYNFSTLKYS
jgi:hypothetical protein